MKKILSVLLCVTLVAVGVFAFSGCTKTSDLKYDVALITDGGSIHDKAYNQSAWDGVQTYANENSAKAVYYQPALEENQELTTDVVDSLEIMLIVIIIKKKKTYYLIGLLKI